MMLYTVDMCCATISVYVKVDQWNMQKNNKSVYLTLNLNSDYLTDYI